MKKDRKIESNVLSLEDIITSLKEMILGTRKNRNFQYSTILSFLEELQERKKKSFKPEKVVQFVVKGEPVAKARPRLRGRGYGAYTPQKTVDYEDYIKAEYIRQVKEFRAKPAFEASDCIGISVDAYFTIPKETSKKKIEYMNKGLIRPTKKPDWDNVGKIVSDALNQLAFYDDKQIVDASVHKYYSSVPRIEVTLYKYPCFNANMTIKEIERKMMK